MFVRSGMNSFQRTVNYDNLYHIVYNLYSKSLCSYTLVSCSENCCILNVIVGMYTMKCVKTVVPHKEPSLSVVATYTI